MNIVKYTLVLSLWCMPFEHCIYGTATDETAAGTDDSTNGDGDHSKKRRLFTLRHAPHDVFRNKDAEGKSPKVGFMHGPGNKRGKKRPWGIKRGPGQKFGGPMRPHKGPPPFIRLSEEEKKLLLATHKEFNGDFSKMVDAFRDRFAKQLERRYNHLTKVSAEKPTTASTTEKPESDTPPETQATLKLKSKSKTD
jgi:hypothetical protein